MPDTNPANNSTTMIHESESGVHVTGGPLTTAITSATTTILQSEVDSRLVKIRPMSTPLDQISRHGDVRRVGSMKVNYYAVEVKDISAVTSADLTTDDFFTNDDGVLEFTLKTDKNAIFSVSETLMSPGDDMAANVPFYVLEADAARGIRVIAPTIGTKQRAAFIAAMKAGRQIIRMGRAAAELDVQTAQFEALPRRRENFCQIFK